MNLDLYFNNENEKPLDNFIQSGGGMVSIFRTIGCVGDSLSSGEFECVSDEGITGWHDFYEYSWGQFMARAAGSKVYNFSRGGMTAKAFNDGFGDKCGAWKYENTCQAYIMALGVNDIGDGSKLGTKEDIDKNNETFVSNYAGIIRKLKRRQPEAKFFLITIPRSNKMPESEALRDRHAELIYEIAGAFKNCYVIDLRKYAPVFDEEFKKKFFLVGHMNPAGYLLFSQMVISYIDYIIRHNMEDFKQIGFIGTPYHSEKE